MVALNVSHASLVILCVLAAGADLLARRVPNALLAAVALMNLGWLAALAAQGGLPAWPDGFTGHLLGSLIGFAALLPFWMIGWMGAGDVKLFSLLGFILGFQALLPIWITGSVIAGIHAATVLLLRRQPLVIAAGVHLAARPWCQRLTRWRRGRSGLPYAAYLAAGALLTIRW